MTGKATSGATCMTIGLAALVGCSQTNAGMKTALTSEGATESYSLGVAVAQQARAGLGEVDDDAFIAGVADAMAGRDLAVSPSEMTAALDRFDARRAKEVQDQVAAIAQANRIAGDEFRQAFAADPEVVKTESGLLYKVLEAGEGEVPTLENSVTLHYRGTFTDGREIDSTYARNEPVTIPLDRGLPGWTEALSLMPAGSKWQIVLPPELAFGERGAGPLVGPSTTVVFEMELVSVS